MEAKVKEMYLWCAVEDGQEWFDCIPSAWRGWAWCATSAGWDYCVLSPQEIWILL